MARQLGTARALAYEAARLLHVAARRTAERLVGEDAKAPTGDDLLDRLTRAYYGPLMDAKKEQARAKARAALESEMRQQQKRVTGERPKKAHKGKQSDLVPAGAPPETIPYEAPDPTEYPRNEAGT